MALEVTSNTFSITPKNKDKYDQAVAEYLENGWDVLSTVPYTVSNGQTTDLFVTFARDLEDDEEESDEE